MMKTTLKKYKRFAISLQQLKSCLLYTSNWWKAVCETSRRLLEQVPAGDIAAVAFSGQMMGCVCLGKRGELLRDGIIWADQRAVQQAQNLEKDISQQEFYRITGHRISASYSLEKLMWVKDHEPDVFSKLGKCLNPKDYVVYQLTGCLLYTSRCV